MTTPTPSRDLIDSAPDLEAPRYGLLSVAQLPAEAPGHWQLAGVTYDSDHCADVGSVDGPCPDITPPAPVTQNATVVFTPVAVTPPALDVTVTYSSTPDVPATLPVTLHTSSASDGGGPETFTVTIASDQSSKATVTVTVAGVSHDIAPDAQETWSDLEAGTQTVTLASAAGTVTPESDDITVGGSVQDIVADIQPPTTAHTLTAASPAASQSAIGITVGGERKALQPGQQVTWPGQAAGAVTATYDSSRGTVTPRTSQVTLPLGSPADRAVTIQPDDTYTIAAASPAASEFPVAFASTPEGITGTRQPGQDAPAATGLAAGTYAIRITGPTGATGDPVDLVLPGAAVTLAATRDVPGPPRPEDSSHFKPKAEGLDIVEGFDPFTVYHRFECNPVGMGDDVHATARRRLQLAEWRQVEARHWAQLVAAHDAGDAIDLGVADPGIDFKEAVGTLEFGARYYGTFNGLPTLHVPMWTQPYFSDASLIEDDDHDGIMRTKLGSRIAFYTGYDGSTQVPAGTFLAFATGPVRAFRSDVFSNESFDPPTNTRTVVAERTWALDHDCLLAVIRMSVIGLG
ncbi:hypothetical protein DY218_27220 [Streptomyces triticagri]|uniref:Uncharacterized protein n=1 Tax=Streptomyces triticagri TaxID=2293568 RepID=A0A372LY97_9ACTN|nr:hypothetical protein [Streptomyces triticagri]RFU83601.1 hypothetical protein DY218_27220 [Streptomyces triticagri]